MNTSRHFADTKCFCHISIIIIKINVVILLRRNDRFCRITLFVADGNFQFILSVWQCQTFRNFYRLAGFSLYDIPPVNFGFLITFCLFQADIGIRRCIIHIIHHKMAGSLICKADVKCCPGKCGEIFCSVYLRIVCISKIFPFYLLPVICIILCFDRHGICRCPVDLITSGFYIFLIGKSILVRSHGKGLCDQFSF